MKRMRVRLITALAWAVVATTRASVAVPPAETNAFDFQEASRNVPKPRELYPLVKQDMVPMDLKILSDEIVPSDTDPSKKLRKITGRFHSIELENKKWIHPFVLLTPADNSINQTPQRKGKVVIVTSPGWVSLSGPRRNVRRADRRADRLSDHGRVESRRLRRRARHRGGHRRA